MLLDDQGKFGASCIGMILLCFFLEFLKFIKWFVSSRKRITSNSLLNLIEFNKDSKTRKKELRKIRLNMFEKALVVILHFMIKFITFLLACLIMQTYNMGYVILISVGLALGNLIFGLL
jgi:hypothetical protein